MKIPPHNQPLPISNGINKENSSKESNNSNAIKLTDTNLIDASSTSIGNFNKPTSYNDIQRFKHLSEDNKDITDYVIGQSISIAKKRVDTEDKLKSTKASIDELETKKSKFEKIEKDLQGYSKEFDDEKNLLKNPDSKLSDYETLLKENEDLSQSEIDEILANLKDYKEFSLNSYVNKIQDNLTSLEKESEKLSTSLDNIDDNIILGMRRTYGEEVKEIVDKTTMEYKYEKGNQNLTIDNELSTLLKDSDNFLKDNKKFFDLLSSKLISNPKN